MLKIYLGGMVPKNAIRISDIEDRIMTDNGGVDVTYLSGSEFINVSKDHDNTVTLEFCSYYDDYITTMNIFRKVDPMQVMIYYDTNTLCGYDCLKLKHFDKFKMINSYRSLKISGTGIEVIVNQEELNRYKLEMMDFIINSSDYLFKIISNARDLKKKIDETNKQYNEDLDKLNKGINNYLISVTKEGE